jgi:hypothetical protein
MIFLFFFFSAVSFVTAYDDNCINANEFTHCDITKKNSACYTCMNNIGADYSWVQQYMAYHISGNCEGLTMKITGSAFNTMYKYNLSNNETINICSDQVSGDFVLDMRTAINYESVPDTDDCQIGVNLFIGTPIDNLCN